MSPHRNRYTFLRSSCSKIENCTERYDYRVKNSPSCGSREENYSTRATFGAWLGFGDVRAMDLGMRGEGVWLRVEGCGSRGGKCSASGRISASATVGACLRFEVEGVGLSVEC